MADGGMAVEVTWDEVVAAGQTARLEPARWRAVVEKARQAGWTAAQAAATLHPALAAQQDGLDGELILARVEAGLAERALPEEVRQAASRRLECLRIAQPLTQQAGGDAELQAAMTLALESGVDEAAIQAVLSRDSGGSDRMPTVMEAAAAMTLAGVDGPTVCDLMGDYVERKLRRSEILRATRFVIQRRRAGNDGKSIRRELWGAAVNDAAAVGATDGASRRLRRGGSASGGGSDHNNSR